MRFEEILLHPRLRKADEIMKFKCMFLFFFSLLSIVPLTVFLSKFLTIYDEFSAILKYSLILLTINLPVAFFLLRFKGLYKIPAIISIVSTCSAGIIMIYLVGGFNAPGYFWIAMMPLGFALILGSNWAMFSGISGFSIIVLFIYFDTIGFGPNIIPSQEVFIHEKRLNIIMFLFFVTLTSYFFSYLASRSQSIITKQKAELEDLIQILVHDVSNPLMVAVNRLNRLRKRGSLSEQDFETISKSIESISKITTSVKNKLKADININDIELNPVNIVEVLKDSIEMFSELTQKRAIEIEFATQDEQSYILAQRDALEIQIFNNIISNAIKYSFDNSKIKISLVYQNGSVVVKIQDTGVGISNERLEKVLDSNIVDSTKSSTGEIGTGFGVNIAKKFVHSFNGQLNITSSTDQLTHGTTVELIFPRTNSNLDA